MKLKMLATMAVLILSAGLSQAQILGVSVKAVGSVTVKSAGGQDCLFIDLRLANSNEVPILMKQVSLKDIRITQGGQSLTVGTGSGTWTQEVAEIPAKTENAPLTARVDLPADKAAAYENLRGLLNVLGSPQSKFTLLLNADAKVGEKHPNGVVWKALEFEMNFTPTVQRDVLVR